VSLILTALTPKYVIQVSDRRVVWRRSSGPILKSDDEHIKAILTPSFACSYVGPARLGKMDTAEWVAIKLSDHICDPDRGIAALLAAVEQEVHIQRIRDQPLAIVCAGWIPARDNTLLPLAKVISNFDQSTSRVLGKFSQQDLSILPQRYSTVIPTGQRLHNSELLEVNQNIERLCKSDRVTARAIAQMLAECVRAVAQSPDRKAYVSEEVLISSLPRDGNAPIVGKLVENFWSVTCIRAGKSLTELPGGPIIVGNKGVIQALFPEDRPHPSTGAKLIRKAPQGDIVTVMTLTNPPLGEAWRFPGTELGKDFC
jgi:hypothetical protein